MFSILNCINKIGNKKDTNLYKQTKTIINKLISQGIKYDAKHFAYVEGEGEDHDWIKLNLKSSNIASINVELFLFKNNSFDVRIPYLCKVGSDKIISALQTINKLNKSYVYAKFFIDEENNICVIAESNLYLNDIEFESRAINFVVEFMDVFDEVYPKIMKEAWS